MPVISSRQSTLLYSLHILFSSITLSHRFQLLDGEENDGNNVENQTITAVGRSVDDFNPRVITDDFSQIGTM